MAAGAPSQAHPQLVVSIGEAVGLDAHRFAGNALGGEAAAIDTGRERVDDGADAAIAAVDRRHGRHGCHPSARLPGALSHGVPTAA
jgi:hypothetical protein